MCTFELEPNTISFYLKREASKNEGVKEGKGGFLYRK